MKITTPDILSLNPCDQWKEKIPSLVGRGMTPRQIATTDKVEPTWRYWVLTRLLANKDGGLQKLVGWAAGVAQDARKHITDDDTADAADTAIGVAVACSEGVAIEYDTIRDAANAASDAANAAANAASAAANAASAAANACCAAYACCAAANAAYAASDAADVNRLHLRWLMELARLVEFCG